ncbi:uncharacterized protein LOC132904097 [Amyelois transitella]|uniref:uncharacterized protein LOC132904097 n=1 Tax=Amyelois transitella TaxID=680683 RepID=UPI00299028E5|nr:uncharacterized protein LOC132904097 [Amyelois transitella]
MVLTRSRAESSSAGAAQANVVASPPPTPEAVQQPAPAPEAVPLPPLAPIMITTEQLRFLMERVNGPPTVSSSLHGNFAKCTARFDGEKSSNVESFVDAIEVYKDCVGVSDENALRGLPMLLTGLAATWWQGVKDHTPTWSAAIEALKQTFGPRALMSQLPLHSLSMTVQLDMTYGLLHRRIREKVSRLEFSTFAELITMARRVEDILDESRTSTSDLKPLCSTAKPTTVPISPTASQSTVSYKNKARPHCNYCKKYGHLKYACEKLAKQKLGTDGEPRVSTITCFGCGAPGVIRSNCSTCKKTEPVPSVSTSFQSVSANSVNIDSRVRPLLEIEIYGERGKVLIDTGAKHCIGSVSLRAHLVKYGHKFENVFTELKYGDGRAVAQIVECTQVRVRVRDVSLDVKFIMLPNATESLLGMNFIQDAGMVLDFSRGIWFMNHDRVSQPIVFEPNGVRSYEPLHCSSVGLHEDEGFHLGKDERQQLSNLLNVNEDIFTPGGGPTQFAVHHIDTGDASALTRYVGKSPVIAHQRHRGRLAKSQSGRPCNLEGEDIAGNIVGPSGETSRHSPPPSSIPRRSQRPPRGPPVRLIEQVSL